MNVNGKVVLITGASRGIGAACADSFARRGALLSLAARSPISYADALTTEVDLTVSADRERLIERTMERYKRIDILVNNAGSGIYGPTATADLAQIERMFALNLFAPVALIQLVLPHMRAHNLGTIVNVSSIAAEVTLPWMTFYSASKAALSAVSTGLRRELADSAIHVTDVLPGYITTSFQSAAEGTPPAGVQRARRHAITSEQCAEAIVRGVERDARTVVAPAYGWLAILAQRLAPVLVDSPLIKMNR